MIVRILILSSMMALGACGGRDRGAEGPAERAGENVDETTREAGEEIEDAAEETGDAVEDAGDDIEQSVE